MISVIIPVYNVELFLEKCIKSVCNQTYKNLEIIIVDDGSLDHSGEICDCLAKMDDRIKIIHQQNEGAGAARNRALECAVGDYIAFVDSDDYIAPEFYEHLIKLMNLEKDIDIAECDYIITDNENAQFSQNQEVLSYSCEEALKENIEDRYFTQLIWNKLYKRHVVEGVKFPVGTKIDDEFWTYQVIGKSRKLIRTNSKLYAYRQQKNSVMHLVSIERRLYESIKAKELRHAYICDNFTDLKTPSIVNLWFTCIYQTQKAMRLIDRKHSIKICNDIQKKLRIYPLSVDDKKGLTTKERIWLSFAQVSLKWTCILRNIFGIGF